MLTQIPLDKLVLSSLNVRQSVDDGGTADLEASIIAHGMIAPLTVHALTSGKGRVKATYGVLAGGRRLKALYALAGRGEIKSDHLVDCVVRDETPEMSVEISIIENVARVALTPVEEYSAFARLKREDPNIDTAAIARRFGVTELHVKQRLRLGSLQPAILEALATGRITLDAAQAYASTADQALQLRVFRFQEDTVAYGKHHAYQVRQLIRRGDSAEDLAMMLKFVGADAYQAAGGQLEEDLFADGVRIVHPGLLAELYYPKLEAETAALAATLPAEVTVVTSAVDLPWSRRVVPGAVLTDEQEQRRRDIDERCDAIHAELELVAEWESAGSETDPDADRLVADVPDDQPKVDALARELQALEIESEAILAAAPTGLPEGPLIAVARPMADGLQVTEYYRAAAAPAASPLSADTADLNPRDSHGLSADSIDVMRSHRRWILRAHMVDADTGTATRTAADYLVFCVLRITAAPPGGRPQGIGIGPITQTFGIHDNMPEISGQPGFVTYARQIVELAEQDWMTEQDLGSAFVMFCDLDPAARTQYAAVAAAQMLDRSLNLPGMDVAAHDQLACALGTDQDWSVRDRWTPDAAFLARLPKKHRLAAVAEVAPRIAKKFEKLKDGPLTDACVRFFAADDAAVREFDMLPGQVMHAKRWVPRFLSFNDDPPGPTVMERYVSEDAARTSRAALDAAAAKARAA